MKIALIKNMCMVLLAVLFSSASVAAGFDCKKARSVTEKLICSDSDLSALDEALQAEYKKVLHLGLDNHFIKKWQRDWLRNNSYCDDKECIKEAWSARYELLKEISAPDGETGRYWRDDCCKGIYKGFDETLYIVGLTKNRIHVSGSAFWAGPNAHMGQINVGNLEGIAVIKDGQATYVDGYDDIDETGCKVDMKFEKDVLFVEDHGGCGGLNVRFTGEYKKNNRGNTKALP